MPNHKARKTNKMSELRLIYDLISQPCRAVVMFLEANKIPYESVVITLTKGTSVSQSQEAFSE